MRLRILVVEDHPMSREMLCDWLEVEGYEAAGTADLKSSFAAIEEMPPHAVLLDINLGTGDGLSVVSWMRGNPHLSGIPVIAVTAAATAADRERILRAGCVACLSKPVEFKLLREGLNRHLHFRLRK
ncbi:MAG: response regulator [Acidobacteriia bacterium]|nr:response regulator [Terriglobia bacterium]